MDGQGESQHPRPTSRREFLKTTTTLFGGTAAALMAPQLGRAAESAAEKPNIVFILADDLGTYDVSWRGSEIKTPNLDALARSGARFEQFYAQPLCSPTRAALMTGRYPMRHGLQTDVVRPWAQYGLPLDERTLAQALHEAGYETAICGKWHLGLFRREYLPTQRGFDHQYGHYNGALDYFTHVRDGGLDWHRDDKVCRDEGYTTHLIAREAVRLIRERDRKKPLFLYVAFNAVHAPHQVPEDYKKPYPTLPEPHQTYAGMLAAMDEAVGQIVAAVDAQGLRKNTLFVFCSDNGGPAPGRVTNNGPLRAAKATLYEGGVRVVGCAAWEGRLKPGLVVNEPFHIVDWYPTILKLAGASLDQPLPLDGRDVWPTIAEGAPSPHEEILINAAPRNGAIRVGNWKLILNGEVSLDEGGAAPKPKKAGKKAAAKAGPSAPVELFDLAADPGEKTNLAEQNPEVVKTLRARYDALARQAVPPKSKPQPADYKAPAVWGESD